MARSRRIDWIDVLRGIAILGILPVNAAYFAYPVALADVTEHPGGAWDGVATWLMATFFEGKMITLFAFLFGLGIALQARRAEETGKAHLAVMARRLVLLAVFGALHGTLLWYGDILCAYGLLGLLLVWFARGTPQVLGIVGAAGIALSAAGLLLFAALGAVAPEAFDGWYGTAGYDGEGAQHATGPLGAFFRHALEVDPDLELELVRNGPAVRSFLFRAVVWGEALVSTVVWFGMRLGGLMLLGMAVVRNRAWLDPDSEPGRRAHRFALRVVLPLSLGVEALAAWADLTSDNPAMMLAMAAVRVLSSTGIAAGLAALVALVVARRSWSRPFAAAGRTALTCYIGQTVLMVTLFRGFDVFDRLDRAELWGVVGVVWVVELIAATLWLRWFSMGPLEWLWRAATYLHLPPLRRNAS